MIWFWFTLGFFGLLIGLSIAYWFAHLWQDERLARFVSFLGAFSAIAIILSFLFTLQNTEKEQERRKALVQDQENAKFTQQTEKYWVDVERQFASSYPFLTTLYKEIYSDAQISTPQLTPDQLTEDKNKTWHMCSELLQIIENVINTSQVNSSDSYGWTEVFISWLKSPTLQNVWNNSKTFFNPETRTFIDGILSGQVNGLNQAKILLTSFKPKSQIN